MKSLLPTAMEPAFPVFLLTSVRSPATQQENNSMQVFHFKHNLFHETLLD